VATNFPASVDSFMPNPSPNSPRNNPSLSEKITDLSDAIVATETKVGATNSLVSSTLDYRTRMLENANPSESDSQIFIPASLTAGTQINAAIASFSGQIGGTIVLGPGTHRLDVPVLIDVADITIKGMSYATSIIEWNPNTFNTAIAMADTTQRRVMLFDLFIRPISGVNEIGTAIDASYFRTGVIERVLIGQNSRAPQIGIDFNSTGTYYNQVQNCFIQANGPGAICIRFGTLGNNANSNMVTNVRCQNANGAGTGIGVQVGGTTHSIHLHRVDVETNDMIGVDIEGGCANVTLLDPYFESINIGVRIGSGAEDINIWGGWLHSSSTANIQNNGAVSLDVKNIGLQFNPYTLSQLTGVAGYSLNGTDIPGNVWLPQDQGYVAWAYDPSHAGAAQTMTNGTNFLVRVRVRYDTTITRVAVGIAAAAVGPVAGQSFLGLYNSAGTRIGVTADVGAATTSTGLLSAALTAPVAVTAGDYWIAAMFNAATPATCVRDSGASGQPWLLGATAANYRYAINGTALTALPASITPASNTALATTLWAAAS
jgi:hypothetical protein